MNRALACRYTVRTISDEHLEPDAALQAVARLESPRHRFISELLWPHVSSPDFAILFQAGSLTSASIPQLFSTGGTDPFDRLLRLHTLALAAHCQALEAELDYLEGLAPVPDGKWESALATWLQVWGADPFWDYLRKRVAALDDPRLLDQDVDRARAELPGLLLGLHETFAERYAALENYGDCARHLTLIRQSQFPEDSIRTATLAAVKKVAGTRLEDLQRRAKQAIAELKDHSPRTTFEAAVGPLLGEALEMHRLLIERLGVRGEYLEQSAFDRVAHEIQKAANKKIDYSDDHRERNLLYCSLISKRLLSLPLSGGLRRTIEQSILGDNRILYSQYGMDAKAYPEALKCFFIEGAEADPEASLIVGMYQITGRELQVNHAAGSAGVRVQWTKVRLLVPRSKLAAQHAKGGKVPFAIPEGDYNDEQQHAAAALKTLETDHCEARNAQKASGEAGARAEEQRTRSEQDHALARAGTVIDEAKREIATSGELEASQLSAEKLHLEAQRKRAMAEHEPVVEAAKRHGEERLSRISGLRGFASIDLPCCVGVTLLIWLANGDLAAAGVLGLIGGLVAGRVPRTFLRPSIARSVAAPAAARDAALAALDEVSGAKEQAIRESAVKRCRPWRQHIDALEAEKKRIQAAGRQRIDAIKKITDEQCQMLDRTFQDGAKPLRAKLSRTVDVKKESQKTEFPAYGAAKRKGFKEGSELPKSERQMTSSEEAEAILRLRLGR